MNQHSQLKPGMRLVRNWQGKSWQVLVLEDGYVFGDRQYASLTQIARVITGTAWSGPRFFGLTARKKTLVESSDG